ncbi:hypothetical protein F5Y09DRAFT_322684 [Xylaria sp. FL1042]|nr:hypothetical protein F5Y09DRAFT_322684 [Xylaria sp. FL1042]
MSNSEAIIQCVIIYPHPDKWVKVKTLMNEIAESVKTGEPDTLIYAVHENVTNPEAPMLLVWEKYGNREAQAAHRQNPKLAELVRQNESEGLIARPFEIIPLVPLFGKIP